MKKLTIISDLDEIAAGLLVKWIGRYNADHDDDVTIDDVVTHELHAHVKIGKDIYKYIDEDGFFDDLTPVPGAVEALTGMARDGHDVVFASAHSRNDDSARAKISWARRHFGFSRKQVILIHPKAMLRGDVFIDDSPLKLASYREAWPQAKLVTISYPFNQISRGIVDLMADDHTNPAAAWAKISAYIREISNT